MQSELHNQLKTYVRRCFFQNILFPICPIFISEHLFSLTPCLSPRELIRKSYRCATIGYWCHLPPRKNTAGWNPAELECYSGWRCPYLPCVVYCWWMQTETSTNMLANTWSQMATDKPYICESRNHLWELHCRHAYEPITHTWICLLSLNVHANPWHETLPSRIKRPAGYLK